MKEHRLVLSLIVGIALLLVVVLIATGVAPAYAADPNFEQYRKGVTAIAPAGTGISLPGKVRCICQEESASQSLIGFLNSSSRIDFLDRIFVTVQCVFPAFDRGSGDFIGVGSCDIFQVVK